MLPAPPHRIQALDGVRGLAAVVVMLHHALLSLPVLALPYVDRDASRASAGWFEGMFIHSPAHIVWEGTAAVLLFFMLSGYVLVLQVKNARTYDWVAYYPHRLVRLYLPVLAALLLAVVLVGVSGTADGDSMASTWTAARPDQVTPFAVLQDATLLASAGNIMSPLWSLQWEVWFSLLLPLFVVIVRPRSGVSVRWVLVAAVLAVIMILTVSGAKFMPLFLIGALLASNQEAIARAAERLNARPVVAAATWLVLGAIAVYLLPSRWTVAPYLTGPLHAADEASARVGAAIASAIIIVMALHCKPIRAMFSSRLLLWIGLRSFSLYLVHEPIIVAASKLFGEGQQWASIPLGIAVSIGVTVLFFRFVEQPSTALSKRIRSAIVARRPVRVVPA